MLYYRCTGCQTKYEASTECLDTWQDVIIGGRTIRIEIESKILSVECNGFYVIVDHRWLNNEITTRFKLKCVVCNLPIFRKKNQFKKIIAFV